MYGSNGWDHLLVIHNSGVEEDPACGPLVALKVLNPPRRTKVLTSSDSSLLPIAVVGDRTVILPTKFSANHH
ncbi:hypothetical protein A2U01_0003119 [Trifolium medium]|uniref:Uncharacterized protein n=1 Tax=Trifolium medium TaxID=97028 RepID=A0A392M4Q9_9FABA|nr:hypothetical protein [Trifolium medium]